jgi:hypothetical protein
MAHSSRLILFIIVAMLFSPMADAQSPSGAFRGSLVCEQLKATDATLRAPLDVIIRGNDVIFARPVFGLRGVVVGSELGTGTITPDGKIHLTADWESGGITLAGDYSGTITPTVGTLTGTEAWHYNGAAETRNCTAALVTVRKAASPASAN